MDRVMALRIVLALAFVLAGFVTHALADDVRRIYGKVPRWIRWADTLYYGLCMWGASVMVYAIVDTSSALFVRDWLSWALPVVIVWPPLRRRAGIRMLTRELQEIARDGV